MVYVINFHEFLSNSWESELKGKLVSNAGLISELSFCCSKPPLIIRIKYLHRLAHTSIMNSKKLLNLTKKQHSVKQLFAGSDEHQEHGEKESTQQ